MATNIQIPNLPVAIALNGQEQIEAVQSGVSVRITTAQIGNLFNFPASPVSSIQFNNAGVFGGSAAMTTDGVAQIILGVDATTRGSLVLKNTAAGAFSTTIQSSNSSTQAWTFTLPPAAAAGNGYILTSTTGGVTSWTNPTALGIDLDVGTTAITNGTAGRLLFEGAGNVLQESANLTFSASALTIGVSGSAAGTLGLSGVTSGVVTLATAAAAGTWTLTLPTTGGTNGFVLTTNGSGVSSWTDPTSLGIDLNIGSTAIVGGTTGRVLYNNAGLLGEYSSVPVNFGGTGLTSLTAGYIPFGAGTSAFGSSGNLFWDNANARLGITTSSPTVRLDLGNLVHVTPATGITLSIWNSSGNFFGIGVSAGQFNYAAGTISSNAHVWHSHGSERMRIDASGNVGIGTGNPAGKLHTVLATDGVVFQANGPVGSLTYSEYSGFSYLWNAGGNLQFGTNTAHALLFGTNNAERMRITASGDVGIGTSSPTYKLDIHGSGADPSVSTSAGSAFIGTIGTGLAIGSSVSSPYGVWLQTKRAGNDGTTWPLLLNPLGGDVGIGTSSPGQKLDVNGTITTRGGTGSTVGYVSLTPGSATLSGALNSYKADGTRQAFLGYFDSVKLWGIWCEPAIDVIFGTNNTERMRITANGSVGIGTSSPPGKLGVKHDITAYGQVWSAFNGATFQNDVTLGFNGYTYFGNFQANPFVFLTNNSERMRIDASGNVGIGTSTPSFLLHVAATNADAFSAVSTSSTANSAQFVSWRGGTNYSYVGPGAAGVFGFSTSEAIPFTFQNNGYVERMRIDASGNVGIGTSSPSVKLDVSGIIQTSTQFSFPGDTRKSVAKIYNDITGDCFGIEQASGAQTGDSAATRLFTSSVGSSYIAFGKYTSSTAFTEFARFSNGGNFLFGATSFGTSAAKVIVIGSGTAPTTGPADTIQIYSTDLSAGNTMLSLYTEGTVVNANTTAAATHRIAIRVNGTVYYLLANTAA